MAEVRPFRLSPSFLEQYHGQQPEWGPVGYVTYKRTYSRQQEDGTTEEFWETCKRVVEGTYSKQKSHCSRLGLTWDNQKAQRSAQEMFTRMWQFKWLPPGRGLWMMGTEYVERAGGMSLNNCAFISTEGISVDFADPFCSLMDMLMLGVGVGFDTKGTGLVKIQEPRQGVDVHVVEDSREGWVALLNRYLTAYSGRGSLPSDVDYSQVREAGAPIRGFGGTASGPGPLQELIRDVQEILQPLVGEFITATAIVDICNLVGRCVVAGNVRRCLPEDSLVHTKEGLKPIKAVKSGDFVQTSKGWSVVTNTFDQGVQTTQRIRTQLGYFEATPNHRVKVFTSPTEFCFKRLDELEVGDRMVFSARQQSYELSEDALPSWSYDAPLHSTTCKDITIPPLDSNISWFLGLFAGDGYVYPNLEKNGFNAYVSVACSSEYPNIISDCRDVVKSFGVNLCDVLPSTQDQSYKVRSQSKQLAWYLSQFKAAGEPLHVPECIRSATPSARAAYIAGLFDADGSSRTRPLQAATSVYLTFLEEVQALLSTLGVPSRLSKNREAAGTWQALYELNIVGELAVERFHAIVGPFSRKCEQTSKTRRSGNDYGFPSDWIKKRTKIWSRTSKQMTVGTYQRAYDISISDYPVEVLEVGLDGRPVQTYDIEVSGVHEFVVGPGLLVHNSAEIAFGDPYDLEFRNLKNPDVAGDALTHHRWSSNNSVFAQQGMDYTELAEMTAKNGEPGYLWLDNARAFSRMGHPPDWKDRKVAGANPCFVGATKIALADGRGAVSLRELAESGDDVPVYSLDPASGDVTIKWGRQPRLTRQDADLVRVHLESGDHVDCTPDHRWILKDGTWKEAKDLQKGDSLSKFVKRKEPVKKGGDKYWQVVTNTFNSKGPGGRTFEHRLIADFFDPETRDRLYDENKTNGWIKGGLVVHHKDYDPLNNRPENLEWMTFKDHVKLHAAVDHNGEKNGMFGKSHSQKTKDLIGKKTAERCADPVYTEKLKASHTDKERQEASSRMKQAKAEWDKAYYIEQEAATDLDTVWFGETLHARKICEQCSTEFIVPWRTRTQSYCSVSCHNVVLAESETRKANQRQFFRDRQIGTRHEQLMAYKDLKQSLGRDPRKKEWEAECRSRRIPFRFKSPSWQTSNPHVFTGYRELKSVAVDYNDRVKGVEVLSHKEDVYCMTVDDNHTLVVIPSINPESSTLTGIFTYNCNEQSLESMEICCLVETFPGRHESYDDYEKTLKVAYLYAKTVTLFSTHNERTNQVMLRNRRIGASMSGIVQAMKRHGRREFFSWCDTGYSFIKELDKLYSDWLCIRESIKITSVKPSGSVSLLPGVTPGIHYPHSQYYLRRIRFQENHPLVASLRKAGYVVEKDSYSPNTVVVEFPVEEQFFDRAKDDVSMWEQLEIAAQMQQYWADNQVSVTVTFKPEEANDIKYALELYETRLKGVSFLPILDHGYVQAPYEAISEDTYKSYVKTLKPLKIKDSTKPVHDTTERFCDGDSCSVPWVDDDRKSS